MDVHGIMKTVIISFVGIMLLHYCYIELIELFVPQSVKRDIGVFHNNKYQELVKEIQKTSENKVANEESDFLPSKELEELKSSLFDFVSQAT